MRWALLACALAGQAGCKQILGIEEGVVAFVGHDEDLDGVDDGLDNCPVDPNSAQAENESGIGSVCDPHPETAGDQIAMFLSFYRDQRPQELATGTTAQFSFDTAVLDRTTIETLDRFAASVVSIDLSFGTFVGTDATLELSVGTRKCRIASCNSRICLVADDETKTGTDTFTPGFDVTLALVQTDTMLVCVLTKQGVVVDLPETGVANDHVRVDVKNASMSVKNLIVYDTD